MIWRVARHWPRYLLLAPFVVFFVFPFYWMFAVSLGTLESAYHYPPVLYPLWHWENYTTAWNTVPWARYFVNTVIVSGLSTVLVLVTSTLAGYAFASMRLPGKALVSGIVLAVYMVPQEVTLVPNFIIIKDLGWYDSYTAQWAPFMSSVFGIFLMRQFFLTLPKDLWEAAQLDGCGHVRFLWRVAVPLALPPLITIALIHFVAGWNSFLWPLIVSSSDAVRPIQVGLTHFQYLESTDPVLESAGSFITTLPILVIFLFAQRRLVGGIAATGIRG